MSVANVPLFDAAAFAALSDSRANPEAAAEALRISARYLRAGAVLPNDLAEHLANAFERAGRVPFAARPVELARALHLTSPGNRPTANPFEIGQRVEDLLFQNPKKKTAAIAKLAEEYNCDISTVRRAWRAYLNALEEHNAVE
jgi:hypothetical protein